MIDNGKSPVSTHVFSDTVCTNDEHKSKSTELYNLQIDSMQFESVFILLKNG